MKSFRILQNTCKFDLKNKPTIVINEGDVGWDTAYENWRNNKPPTDSAEWKKGVHLWFKEIPESQAIPDTTPSAIQSKVKNFTHQLLCAILFFALIVYSVICRIFL